MRDAPKMVTGIGRLAFAMAVAILCLAVTAFSQDVTSATVVSSTLFRPAHLEVKDKLYRDYFSGADDAIRTSYSDRWRYHEIQSGFYQRRSTDIHLDIATFSNPSIGPSEANVREEFARAAFRMRIDALIRKLMTDDRAKNLRRAQQFVEALRVQSVKVSDSKDPASPPAEMRWGYDILGDTARLEYLKGTAGVGLYHQKFFGQVFSSRRLEALSLNSWKESKGTLPSASLGYVFGDKAVRANLWKYLNSAVRADLSGVKAVASNGVPDSVLMSVTYTF